MYCTEALKSSAGVGVRRCAQAAVLQRFREGAVDVLISTSVAEEGLDVQARPCFLFFLIFYILPDFLMFSIPSMIVLCGFPLSLPFRV